MRLLVPGGEGALNYAKPRLKALFARMHLLPDRAAGISLKCEVRVYLSHIRSELRGERVRLLLGAHCNRDSPFLVAKSDSFFPTVLRGYRSSVR